MRYRIKDDYVDKGSEYMQITFFAPADFVDSLVLASGSSYELSSASTAAVIEAIRLIANETRGGYVICSTGQKGVVTKAWKNVEQENDLRIQISIAALIAAADGDADDLAAIDAMSITDMYTIEMDFGEAPSDMAGGGGELEPATDAEYAAFKTHMQTEIANILTPITEEE